MKQFIIDDRCGRVKLDKVSQQVIQVTHSVNEKLISTLENGQPPPALMIISPALKVSSLEIDMDFKL